jgi:glycosyltransferase involved in cell wall biosynthesis
MIKISIITINYKDLQGLKKTVESVLNQRCKSQIEYIIIDGGSEDGTDLYLNERNSEIAYWVSEKDAGIFNAMNKGIAKATGDYLLFLNSGDCLNGSSALSDFITHPNFQGDIIYGDLKIAKGSIKFPKELTPFYFVMSSLPHQATLFRKEVFEAMGLYDEQLKISSDRGFYMKCFLSNRYHFQHIPIELALFDQTGISNSPKYNEVKRAESKLLINQYYGIYANDYFKMEEQRVEIIKLKLNTIKGFINRVINKISKIISK